MTGRRSKTQRERDLAEIAQLYIRGVTQQEIADTLDLTQQTVSNDLQTLYARWQDSAIRDVDEMKAQELARIDELERTYWTEWEASKTEHVTTTTKAAEAGGGPRKEATVRKESRLGDPRYLAGVQWCIARRCAILGIDAPQERHVKGEMKHKVDADVNLSGLTTEQLEALAAWDAEGEGES